MNAQPIEDGDALALLTDLVRIPSVSGDEARAARFLAGAMGELGFDAHVDEAGNPVGVAGDGPITVALVGHVDTVHGGPPVRVEDGRLFGRGSVDAKGPLAAFVVAASRAAALAPDLRIVVVGCVEEEAPSSRGARHVLATHTAPDFLVVGEPSGWDGITLGYKGYLRATLELEGDCAHTAHDEETIPARACAVWQEIRMRAARFDVGRTRAFERLMPALVDLSTKSDGSRARARLDLSLRLPPDLAPAAALEWLSAAAPGCTVEMLGALPAWSGPRTTPLARTLARAIRSQGGTPRFQVKTGTADLNILAPAWGCPALAYGPGDASLDHTPNENVELAEFLRGAAVLEETLVGLAATRSPAAVSV